MNILKQSFLIAFALGLVWTPLYSQRRVTTQEYIEKYKHLALAHQEKYGIPASIKMAQALLESDCGNSRLATLANNHFGIKCKSDWTGETISHDDDAPQECFRKYGSVEESFDDHSEFLDNSPRYQKLFELEPTDYKGWARELKAAGYATNPRYAELLIDMIENNQLYALDAEGSPQKFVALPPERTANYDNPVSWFNDGDKEEEASFKVDVDNYVVSVRKAGGRQVFHNNGSQFVVAQQGDTYESLAVAVGTSAKKLRKFNDTGSSYQPLEGEQVYIMAKSNRANNGKLLHLVEKGQTLRYISQLYGIKLSSLAKLNRIAAGTTLNEGLQIRLM